MRGLTYLAWQYLRYHRTRTLLLVFSISLCCALPVAIRWATSDIERLLLRRAESVPYVVGRPGSPLDLVLSSLYFKPQPLDDLQYSDFDTLDPDDLVLAIPLHLKHSSQKQPIVGTTLGYFRLLNREIADGTLPRRIGDCVLGADVAARLQLSPGDRLLSDGTSFLNPAGQLPLNMRVTGILARTGQADDDVIFADIKTSWLMDGIGHGHTADVSESAILHQDDGGVTLGANVENYLEVTDENASSFHFHGNNSEFPLTSILVFPRDERSAVIWEGRQLERSDVQTVIPLVVVEELLRMLVNLQFAIDIATGLLGAALLLLLILLLALSTQLRASELQTLQAIGAGRAVRWKLILLDVGLVFVAAIPLTAVLVLGMQIVGRSLLIQLVL
ncbi:ABC transporter permease [bacterium]|nr:ABC transporter permease [bacterium]